MKKFCLEIDLENEAFEPSGYEEIARILRHVADQVQHGRLEGRIFDINGNRVGFFDTN